MDMVKKLVNTLSEKSTVLLNPSSSREKENSHGHRHIAEVWRDLNTRLPITLSENEYQRRIIHLNQICSSLPPLPLEVLFPPPPPRQLVSTPGLARKLRHVVERLRTPHNPPHYAKEAKSRRSHNHHEPQAQAIRQARRERLTTKYASPLTTSQIPATFI